MCTRVCHAQSVGKWQLCSNACVHAQVPFLAGSKLGDQRQIKPVIWLSAFGALGGVSLLENGGGSPPGVGDLWSLLSAIFFGVQVSIL